MDEWYKKMHLESICGMGNKGDPHAQGASQINKFPLPSAGAAYGLRRKTFPDGASPKSSPWYTPSSSSSAHQSARATHSPTHDVKTPCTLLSSCCKRAVDDQGSSADILSTALSNVSEMFQGIPGM